MLHFKQSLCGARPYRSYAHVDTSTFQEPGHWRSVDTVKRDDQKKSLAPRANI
jgi:hypothetical protein